MTRWASVLGTLGPALTIPGAGYLAFVLPVIGESSAADAFAFNQAVMEAPLFTASLATSGLAVTAAFVLAVIALRRDGIIGVGSAWLLVVSAAFLSFAPAVPVSDLVYPIDLTGAVLMAAVGVWMIRLRQTLPTTAP